MEGSNKEYYQQASGRQGPVVTGGRSRGGGDLFLLKFSVRGTSPTKILRRKINRREK